MKRNWDLVREILVRFEEKSSKEKALMLDDWAENSQSEISYNVELLLDGDLLKGEMLPIFGEGPTNFLVTGLTWRGLISLMLLKMIPFGTKLKNPLRLRVFQ